MSRQYTGEWVVSSLLAERAERFGTEIAVSSEQGQLTYEDLVERAARMAGGFAALGARPGDRIATMLPTGNDYLAAWHACIWLGAIEVPVNVEYRGAFLEHILQDSGATILVVHARWLQRLGAISLSDVRHLVVVGEPEEAVEMPAGIATHAFPDVLGHEPVRAPPFGRARPHLHHVHVGNDRAFEGRGAQQPQLDPLPDAVLRGARPRGRRRLLFDVPAVPPDGALRLHDLRALGREPRRAALRVLGEQLLGRHP